MVRSTIPNDWLVADDRFDFRVGCHRRKIALNDWRIKNFRLNIARNVDIGSAVAVASVKSTAVAGGGILRHANKIGLIMDDRPPAMSIIWRREVLGRRSLRLTEKSRGNENQSPAPRNDL